MPLDGMTYREIGDYLMHGDVRGLLAYLKNKPELAEYRAGLVSIFEDKNYISYEVPDESNRILLCYQMYFRDVFYLGKDHAQAESELFEKLKWELDMPNGGLEEVEEEMKLRFNRAGYQVLFGITNGYRGPYVWRETVPMTFEVELPDMTSRYRINMLRGFVFRGWMDYLTFGEEGTGGWASPDGTINCVEKAYDLNSERFRVSLLKHEAQHTEDMKRWEAILPWELEYRAKLVELIYTEDPRLLDKFLRQADAKRAEDSHAIAAARIANELGTLEEKDISVIRERARELFSQSTREMDLRYAKPESSDRP